MKIINKYIGKQVIIMILLVAIALLGVDLFIYLVNELKFVGKGNYHLSTAFAFVALTIPRKLYYLFPWSALLGTLLALGQLAKASELVVMRASAISIHKIAWATLRGALLLTIIAFIFGEVISPVFERVAQQKKIQALSIGKTIQTEHGIWIKNKNEFIHIDAVLEDSRLQQITRYTFNEKLELQEIIYADNAVQVDNGWLLKNVTGTKFAEESTNQIKQDELFVSTLLNKEILEVSSVKHLERLALKNLHRIIQQREENGLNVKTYEVAFWTKIFQPFSVLVMVYLVIPFVFGPLRSSSVGLRLLVGIIIGFSFHVINTIGAQLPMVINMPPVIALAVAPTIFCVGGIINMLRIK
jgi:lipopolysaccharide export system permease protein